MLSNKTKNAGEIATDYLSGAGKEDPNKLAAFFAADGVFEIPYAQAIGMTISKQGPEEIEQHIRGVFSGASKFRFIKIRVVLENKRMAVMEYETDFVLDNGRPYLQHLIGFFEIENGKIKHFREFLNTVVAARAFLPDGIKSLS